VQKIKLERQSEGVELKQPDILLLMASIRILNIDTTLPDDASRYVLHPNAYVLRRFWDPLQRLLAVFFFLEVPFTISFHTEYTLGAPAAAALPGRTPAAHKCALLVLFLSDFAEHMLVYQLFLPTRRAVQHVELYACISLSTSCCKSALCILTRFRVPCLLPSYYTPLMDHGYIS
jgi:hypothetical protein